METSRKSTVDNRGSSRWVGYFVASASAIFFITGLVKLISSFGRGRILNEFDPVFGFSYRTLFFSVGLIELAVAAALLVSTNPMIRLIMIAWLVSAFWIYRSAVHFLGDPKPCKCLGTLTQTIHIPEKTAENSMLFALCYLTCGVLGLLSRETVFLAQGSETTL